jgi:hypothetical protein
VLRDDAAISRDLSFASGVIANAHAIPTRLYVLLGDIIVMHTCSSPSSFEPHSCPHKRPHLVQHNESAACIRCSQHCVSSCWHVDCPPELPWPWAHVYGDLSQCWWTLQAGRILIRVLSKYSTVGSAHLANRHALMQHRSAGIMEGPE